MAKPEWRKFVKLCAALSEDELDQMFKLFLTAAEREDIADRYTILTTMLNTAKTHREIASECCISIAKVSRGSNAIKTAQEYYPEIINKLLVTPADN